MQAFQSDPAATARPDDGGSIAYVWMLTLVAALGGLLFGYDTAVISGAIGFLQIHFHLDPLWKGWTAASVLVGCVAGAGLAGFLSDRLGRKKVLVISAILFLVSALGTAFPRDLTLFVIFRIIGGLGIGAASMASPMYIAEISPARIRGRMVSVNQFAIVSGILIVYFVNLIVTQYGSAVESRAMAEHHITLDAALDNRLVADFVAKFGPEISQKLNEIQAEHPRGWKPRELVDFLRTHELVVDDTTVALAVNRITAWNIDRGWRWMFGTGAIPSLLLLGLLLLVPESPRWLTERDRADEALAVLTRVGGAQQARRELADIQDAIAQETGSLAQLFEPGMRAALVIGVVLAVLQQVTGINVFLYYGTEIFKHLSSESSTAAMLMQVLVGGVNLTFTVIAIWTVDRLGRKPLMLVGSAGMGLALAALGWAAYTENTSVWMLPAILGYIACFALSVGPVVWVILSEIFPTRIRGRAMALATICLWAANFLVTQTFTMMDASPRLVGVFHHAFPYWLYAALCVVMVLFVWRYLPETKGRSLEEIERSWVSRG